MAADWGCRLGKSRSAGEWLCKTSPKPLAGALFYSVVVEDDVVTRCSAVFRNDRDADGSIVLRQFDELTSELSKYGEPETSGFVISKRDGEVVLDATGAGLRVFEARWETARFTVEVSGGTLPAKSRSLMECAYQMVGK